MHSPMPDLLEKKRQGLEMLLHEMENLRNALQDGRIEDLDNITARQKAVIQEIESLDREYGPAEGAPGYPKELVEKARTLVAHIAEINETLIAMATGQAKGVQQELGTLRRRIGAVAGYRKQANVKI